MLESSSSSAWVSSFKQLYAFITCKIASAAYPESFSSASEDFFHIYFITFLLFIKKAEDSRFQGGNNSVKHVNVYFFCEVFLLPCCILFPVLYVWAMEIRGTYCSYIQH